MNRRARAGRLVHSLAVVIAVGTGSAVAVAAPSDPGELCDRAARHAAAVTQVPLDLLRAIMLTETGLLRGGRRGGWAWATNAGGAGAWHPDRATARAYLARLLAGGARNVDIGCFQMNYRWHAHRFTDLDAMLDPFENAVQAARFLTELRTEFGDWHRAAGAYHSRDPGRAARYLARVDANRNAGHTAAAAPRPARAEATGAPRGYPLLFAGPPRGSASLVPGQDGGVPLVAAARRPLLGEG